MNPKYTIGQRIKFKDHHDEWIHGHVVLIIDPFISTRIYYCSMYPGAMPNYHWVRCVDLNSGCILNADGTINVLQALNTFTEDQLESAEEESE